MRLLFLLVTIALPLTALAVPPPQTTAIPAGVVSLASLRGNAWPLLIFAAKPDDSQLEIQLRRLHDNASAVAERDVVVIAVPYESPSPTQAMLSDDDAEAARRRFHVAPEDFAIILLGKDGREKLRSSKPISIDKLRTAIEATMHQKDER